MDFSIEIRAITIKKQINCEWFFTNKKIIAIKRLKKRKRKGENNPWADRSDWKIV